MKPENVLILPGWQNSGPDHWQSRWEAVHGFRRVDQHDWMTPRRGDWIARLEDVILGCDGPVVLVAHSLGCILTAAWAQVSRSTARVQGALLVAPGDPEREELRPLLPSWAPIVRQRLPFPSVLVGSRNDPYCSFDKAQSLAGSWGARFVDLGERGHINAESGLGDWPEGLLLLEALQDVSPSAMGQVIRKISLPDAARALPTAWKSMVLGQAAGANFKVLRMDAAAYPDESHDFDEALLVLDGQMNLTIQGQQVVVSAGEVFIVPAGVPHAVAPGSHGTLVIIDR